LKKTAFFIILLLLLGGSTAAWHELGGGSILAAGLSWVLSKKTGLRLSLSDVRIECFKQIRFGFLTLADPKEHALLAAGPGRLKKGAGYFEGTVDHVVLMQDLYRGFPFAGWVSQHLLNDPIYLRRLHWVVRERPEGFSCHLLQGSSEEVRLKGGFSKANGRLQAVHFLIDFPHQKFEELPKELRASFIRRRTGWAGIRLTLRTGIVVLSGQNGPFLRASWQSEHPADILKV